MVNYGRNVIVVRNRFVHHVKNAQGIVAVENRKSTKLTQVVLNRTDEGLDRVLVIVRMEINHLTGAARPQEVLSETLLCF